LLKSDGFVVESVQSSPAFHRYRVPKGEDSVLIDLVADPVPALEEPREFFLERDLAQAPQKDPGFSPLTFAWVLRELPITSLGLGSGWPVEEIASLDRFRGDLVQTVARLAKPE